MHIGGFHMDKDRSVDDISCTFVVFFVRMLDIGINFGRHPNDGYVRITV